MIAPSTDRPILTVAILVWLVASFAVWSIIKHIKNKNKPKKK